MSERERERERESVFHLKLRMFFCVTDSFQLTFKLLVLLVSASFRGLDPQGQGIAPYDIESVSGACCCLLMCNAAQALKTRYSKQQLLPCPLFATSAAGYTIASPGHPSFGHQQSMEF